jgi:hypothetical protein
MHTNAKALLDNESIDLNTLFDQEYARDEEDLKALHSYLLSFDASADERKEALKRICIKHKINSPLLGPLLYDPNKFDKTRDEP